MKTMKSSLTHCWFYVSGSCYSNTAYHPCMIYLTDIYHKHQPFVPWIHHGICWCHIGSKNRSRRLEELKNGSWADFEDILIGVWELTFPGTFLGAISPISLGLRHFRFSNIFQWAQKGSKGGV